MGYKYINNRYAVTAADSREVIVNDRKGVITKDMGHYIGVVFYDDKKANCVPCHPTWEVEYLDTFNYKPPKPKNPASKERYKNYLSLDTDMTFFEYLKSLKK